MYSYVELVILGISQVLQQQRTFTQNKCGEDRQRHCTSALYITETGTTYASV